MKSRITLIIVHLTFFFSFTDIYSQLDNFYLFENPKKIDAGKIINTSALYDSDSLDYSIIKAMSKYHIPGLSACIVKQGDTFSIKVVFTGIAVPINNVPDKIQLFQNYPNPFNPTTIFVYNLPWPGKVKLTVYNALGKKVAELINDFQVEGSHSVTFDAQYLPTGIYLYQLQIDGEFSEMKKMVLLK